MTVHKRRSGLGLSDVGDGLLNQEAVPELIGCRYEIFSSLERVVR